MSEKKGFDKTTDDFDYLSNAASATDCTGLIPSLPLSEAELESYNNVYRFYPPDFKRNHSSAEDAPQ